MLKSACITLAALFTNIAYGLEPQVSDIHSPQAEHADQGEFVDLVANGQNHEAFERAFELGDELFETELNAVDGIGANVGQSQRFTRVPRADLADPPCFQCGLSLSSGRARSPIR